MSKSVTRRKLLKGLAAGAIAAASPFIIRQPLASSGEVNVFAWGDYIQDNIKKAFENKTGIKINLSTYGSNEEAQNNLRAAGGRGFDLIFPSVDTRPNYDEGKLLSEIDESRVKIDQIQSGLWRSSLRLGEGIKEDATLYHETAPVVISPQESSPATPVCIVKERSIHARRLPILRGLRLQKVWQ